LQLIICIKLAKNKPLSYNITEQKSKPKIKMNNNFNKIKANAHDAYDNSLDKAVYFFSFLGPVMSIPQIIQAYTVSAAGLSVWTWLAYSINSVFWVLYAFHKKLNVLAFSEILWAIVHFIILFKVVFQ
jgi:hypothetical protein